MNKFLQCVGSDRRYARAGMNGRDDDVVVGVAHRPDLGQKLVQYLEMAARTYRVQPFFRRVAGARQRVEARCERPENFAF